MITITLDEKETDIVLDALMESAIFLRRYKDHFTDKERRDICMEERNEVRKLFEKIQKEVDNVS